MEKRIVSMDLIRGISALLVCASHLRNAIFVDYAESGATGPIAKGFYFLTGLGHESVMVFFVLSGFFVGGSVLKRRSSFRFSSYLTARLSRLWTPLVPALIFTLLIDLTLAGWYPDLLAGEYRDVLTSGPDAAYSMTPLTFLGNLLFLQTVFTPVFGTNSPLWSLAYEFWFYLLFPLIGLVAGFVKTSNFGRAIAVGSLLLAAFSLPIGLFEGFLIWLMGVLVFGVFQWASGPAPRYILPIGVICFGLTLINSSFGLLPDG
ncbi:MAG: acyltransferase family protein, partial [Bacteroidota bacterium]